MNGFLGLLYTRVTFKAVEYRLDEIFQIVFLLEDRNLFSQSGRAGSLIGKGLGTDFDVLHCSNDPVLSVL